MTETSAGKINKEEHIFKSTSGVCDIHTVIWYPDKEKYENDLIAELKKISMYCKKNNENK